jgi:hypothetical protein
MGPEGGSAGGTVIAEGTPEQIVACPESYTGEHLRPLLEGRAVPVGPPRPAPAPVRPVTKKAIRAARPRSARSRRRPRRADGRPAAASRTAAKKAAAPRGPPAGRADVREGPLPPSNLPGRRFVLTPTAAAPVHPYRPLHHFSPHSRRTLEALMPESDPTASPFQHGTTRRTVLRAAVWRPWPGAGCRSPQRLLLRRRGRGSRGHERGPVVTGRRLAVGCVASASASPSPLASASSSASAAPSGRASRRRRAGRRR